MRLVGSRRRRDFADTRRIPPVAVSPQGHADFLMELDSAHALLGDIDMDFLLIKPGQLDDGLTGRHHLPRLDF